MINYKLTTYSLGLVIFKFLSTQKAYYEFLTDLRQGKSRNYID